MSDEAAATTTTGDSPALAEAPAVANVPGAGEMLREAREAAGVDLPSLAAALKVSVKKLEALEANRFEQLPDAVFVRGLASSVCRVLKIDVAPVLQRLPQTTAPRLNAEESGLNTPFHTPGDIAKTPLLDRLSRPMILAALAVLMGALVLILFPSQEQRAELGAIVPKAPAPELSASQPAATPPAVSASPMPTAAPPTAPATPAPKVAPAPEPKPVPPAAMAVAPAKPAVVVPPPAPAATSVAAAPAPAASAVDAPVRKKLGSSGVVVFKTTGPSWVEVTDGNGAIQLSRLVEPGEPVGASGPLPLNVTIGRAELTEVTVRGQPYDLAPVTKQGVARFEVK